MLDAPHIAALQQNATANWHTASAAALSPSAAPSPSAALSPSAVLDSPSAALDSLVLEQHRANFDLWHCEDKARDPGADDSAIAAVKRAIDGLNQRRNDLMERLDTLLIAAITQRDDAPLHSETPGLMIDRLSILSLKLFHTAEEAQRSGTSAEHKARNRERLAVLTEQRLDLTGCLGALWAESVAGRRRFKLYRQMKMYNDATLNPVLYGGSTMPDAPKSDASLGRR